MGSRKDESLGGRAVGAYTKLKLYQVLAAALVASALACRAVAPVGQRWIF